MLYLLLFPAGNAEARLLRIQKIHLRHAGTAPGAPHGGGWRQPRGSLALDRDSATWFRSFSLCTGCGSAGNTGICLAHQVGCFQALSNVPYLLLVDPRRTEHEDYSWKGCTIPISISAQNYIVLMVKYILKTGGNEIA